MPYRKKGFYRPYSKTDKYSFRQEAGQIITSTAGGGYAVIVDPADVEGMRKVKHINISLAGSTTADIYWAIVYVPAGSTVQALNLTGTFYPTPQYVMSCGVYDHDCGPNRIYSKLSRNLNQGDAIYLVIQGNANSSFNYCATYAVTLQ